MPNLGKHIEPSWNFSGDTILRGYKYGIGRLRNGKTPGEGSDHFKIDQAGRRDLSGWDTWTNNSSRRMKKPEFHITSVSKLEGKLCLQYYST